MSLEFALRPSSIEGIKRLADRIEREESIKRAEALERASRSAGFSNYAHARRSLAESPVPEARRHDLHITAYWHDLPTGETGRETLVIAVDHRLDEMILPRQFANNRHLLAFRRKESDHVEGKQVFGDQRSARKAVCGAARALHFIDATGLQPYSRSLVSPIERWQSDPLPGADHASTWRDAASGELVITDEPYRPAISSRDADRLAWAARHGLTLSASAWPGMYAPGAGSSLHVLARDAHLAQRVVGSTGRLRVCPVDETWTGTSAPSRPIYRSPVEAAGRKNVRAPRDPRLARSTARTTPYALVLSGHSRKPTGRMPLDAHDAVARDLRMAIGSAEYRPGVRERLDRVRSELDDWVQVEYDRQELDMERFSEMYYGALGAAFRRRPTVAERAALLAAIGRVREQVARRYPDCEPLRRLIRLIDHAQRSAQSWPVGTGSSPSASA